MRNAKEKKKQQQILFSLHFDLEWFLKISSYTFVAVFNIAYSPSVTFLFCLSLSPPSLFDKPHGKISLILAEVYLLSYILSSFQMLDLTFAVPQY